MFPLIQTLNKPNTLKEVTIACLQIEYILHPKFDDVYHLYLHIFASPRIPYFINSSSFPPFGWPSLGRPQRSPLERRIPTRTPDIPRSWNRSGSLDDSRWISEILCQHGLSMALSPLKTLVKKIKVRNIMEYLTKVDPDLNDLSYRNHGLKCIRMLHVWRSVQNGGCTMPYMQHMWHITVDNSKGSTKTDIAGVNKPANLLLGNQKYHFFQRIFHKGGSASASTTIPNPCDFLIVYELGPNFIGILSIHDPKWLGHVWTLNSALGRFIGLPKYLVRIVFYNIVSTIYVIYVDITMFYIIKHKSNCWKKGIQLYVYTLGTPTIGLVVLKRQAKVWFLKFKEVWPISHIDNQNNILYIYI